MPELDPKVAAIVDSATRDDDSDEDALIAALEDDEELDAFREQRLQQLHAEFDNARRLRANQHGTYVEIKDEKGLMDITTSTKLCVVHFFKPDFNRCRIMDNHLESLAPAHYEARILKINVDNCPFLVTRLKVQVLPCVIAFVDGIGVDRIIGFEGLGRTPENFTTRDLEARLIRANVLSRTKVNKEDERRATQKRNVVAKDEEDYDEWE
ncbi:thioredoxin-like protein [Melanomma pulvis-pyrius CBS 109.77]|uniref:Thioredoxin-like protein n=1 Tax=Melanomma pulvis-pyrius CBS 109.77 TaxID=1314802 RepID=A0A6A6X1L6_9PLEO|nr:thioredoxin-like protein [Melanomma pulvis-pyrius CBS 109.77]